MADAEENPLHAKILPWLQEHAPHAVEVTGTSAGMTAASTYGGSELEIDFTGGDAADLWNHIMRGDE